MTLFTVRRIGPSLINMSSNVPLHHHVSGIVGACATQNFGKIPKTGVLNIADLWYPIFNNQSISSPSEKSNPGQDPERKALREGLPKMVKGKQKAIRPQKRRSPFSLGV